MKSIHVIAVLLIALMLSCATADPPSPVVPSGKTYSGGSKEIAPQSFEARVDPNPDLHSAHKIWVLNKNDMSPEEYRSHATSIAHIISASYTTGVLNTDEAWKGIDLYFTITDAKKYEKKK